MWFGKCGFAKKARLFRKVVWRCGYNQMPNNISLFGLFFGKNSAIIEKTGLPRPRKMQSKKPNLFGLRESGKEIGLRFVLAINTYLERQGLLDTRFFHNSNQYTTIISRNQADYKPKFDTILSL